MYLTSLCRFDFLHWLCSGNGFKIRIVSNESNFLRRFTYITMKWCLSHRPTYSRFELFPASRTHSLWFIYIFSLVYFFAKHFWFIFRNDTSCVGFIFCFLIIISCIIKLLLLFLFVSQMSSKIFSSCDHLNTFVNV